MGDPFVIIGGDAAGMSAASKARREDPDRDIVVFERGEWVSYAACGMPYYVKGDVETLDDLVQVTPAEFRTERDIDLRTEHEVVGIDPDSQRVTVTTNGERFEQPYDTLLIATGAHAIEPPLDGRDLDGVYTIHAMDDADAIQDYIDEMEPESAAIVGGGYVGVEMAEALDAHGIDVSVFEMLPHILQPFGESAATVIEDHLRDQTVDLHLETSVDGFTGKEVVDGIVVDEETIPVEMAIVGVGVAPNVELAQQAGIEIGETGAIATDEFGRTNYENVFAAGDCAQSRHVVTGEPAHVPLALTANRAGRAIGQTVTGTPTTVGDIAGTAIVKAFEYGAARTGILDEQRARDAEFEPVSVEISAPTRAHYYPGAEELTVNLVADQRTNRVIGASLAGPDGLKRIDTVATALHGEMTVATLETLDLAYAPPYSPVWDPVATAARVLNGRVERTE
ncbi:FAD-dependent oxidoreductase [Salinibaculum salinum]|uniref:FAD-dependent oxidoreductase n=1 Tax=Salinibaculum salinum TaxID=3131996 RepID=UPI0030ECD8B7